MSSTASPRSQHRLQLLHELGNPKFAWCRVTKVVQPTASDFYYGFAVDARGRTVYFQKPLERTSIWLGPWEIRSHPPNLRPQQGHLLFGEWEPDRRDAQKFRLKWHVAALDLQRFRRCLEMKNTIFARRPTSAVANAMLHAVLYGDDPAGLSELQRKQLGHVCRAPLDFYLP